MDTRAEALIYAKQFFLNAEDPTMPGRKMTEEQFTEMPEPVKEQMLDFLVGFTPTVKNDSILNEIVFEAKKKPFSNASFGMRVKELVQKLL